MKHKPLLWLIALIFILDTGLGFYAFGKPVKTTTHIPSNTFLISPTFANASLYQTFFEQSIHATMSAHPDIFVGLPEEVPHVYSYKTEVAENIQVLVTDFKNPLQDISLTTYATDVREQQITIPISLSKVYPTLPSVDDMQSFINTHPGSLGIIPFEDLTNTLKVISINHTSPILKSFDKSIYPLASLTYLYATSPLSNDIKAFVAKHVTTNYDPTALHRIILTGTTALGRGEYFKIQQYGTTYPALYVTSILHDADVTQASDEVSYVPNCTQQVGTLTFCALPNFINTLIYAGINLVELTGNHNNDWGAQYSASSLDMYTQQGIKHFGGGYNATDARKPALFTLGNTTYAFLGYNEPGPSYAFATDTQSGAARLSMDALVSDIHAAKHIADVVFVDVQWENENNQFPSNSQITYSHAAIDAGASVVTGSSGHRPQGMEFYHGGTIMYGLGNLFFDQMENLDTRQNVIVRHTFYNNKLIATELIPTLLFDYAQPRPVTGTDAQAIYDEVFQASTGVY